MTRFVCRIAHTPLFIFDDFCQAPLDSQNELSLLELIEERPGRAAAAIATQIPVARWFAVIGDPMISGAFRDRIVPQALRIHLSGTSVRALQGQRKIQIDACVNPST